MRILLVTPAIAGAGAARTWTHWLADSGQDVQVAAPDVAGAALPETVGRVPLPAGRAAPGALRAGLESYRPDVVLALGGDLGATAVRAAQGRVPVVVREDRLAGDPDASLAARVRRTRVSRGYRGAARVAAVSHAVAAELVSAYAVPGSRVVVVPNPIPAAAAPRLSPAVDAPGGESTDGPLALVVPEADAEHAELVLLAAKILRAQGVDARLVTYTGRSSAAGLADTARAAEVPIETLDWTDEWLATTSAGSVVVLPATREAFGDTLVEAASFGIPSVAVSHAFGVADALVPGVSGQFAFTGTPEALAQAVLAARRMPRPDAAGWTARFSPDESGRLLLATLHRAAGLATPVPTPTP